MKSGVFSFCKGIDTFCPLGPWIVTADEIPDPHNLAMELRVNGESRQRSHSSKMSVKIPEILSHYSPMGYSAGDVVSTGTVSGVAAFSGDPKAWYLKPGDVMECEIEKIGVLRNPVISWEQAYRPEAGGSRDAGNDKIRHLGRRDYDHQFENLGQRTQRAAGGAGLVFENADPVLRYDAARWRADGWGRALAAAEAGNRTQTG